MFFKLRKRVARLERMLGWLADPDTANGIWEVTMSDLIRDFKARHELHRESRYWVPKQEPKSKDE